MRGTPLSRSPSGAPLFVWKKRVRVRLLVSSTRESREISQRMLALYALSRQGGGQEGTPFPTHFCCVRLVFHENNAAITVPEGCVSIVRATTEENHDFTVITV